MNLGFLNREVASFHAAALIMGGALLASKLLGLFRDRLLAAEFGAGDTLDVYYAAFQIPDLLYTIFLVGAASAAVLPVFLSYERRSQDEAERFIGNLLTIFSAGALVFVIAAIIAAPWLVKLVVPGFSAAKLLSVVHLTRLMMMGTVFLGAASILSSVLQARRYFFVFALPPIAYNLGIITGIVVLVPWLGVSGLAAGVVLGGILQVVIQLPAFAGMGFRIRPAFSIREPGFIAVVRTSLPRVLALTMSQITIVVLAATASLFASGSISVFKLAANLLYVPVGLFGVSYALAMFPKLSASSLAGEGKAFREHVVIGVRNILFWTVPAAAIAIVLRAHLVRVILGSGAFNWEDTRLVAAVLAVLAVAIVSESLLPLILRAFYALGNTRSPLMWDILGSAATIAFAGIFAVWFSWHPEALAFLARMLRIGDLAAPKILAVAFGFLLGSLLNVGLLFFALQRVVRERFGTSFDFEIAAFFNMAGAALLAGCAAYAALLPFPSLVSTNTFIGIFLQGLVSGIVGILVYAGVLWLEGNLEIRALAESFRQRLISPKKTPAVYEAEKLDGESGK